MPPVVIRNDDFCGDWNIAKEHLKGTFDNVVISPGPGHPANTSDFGLCVGAIKGEGMGRWCSMLCFVLFYYASPV